MGAEVKLQWTHFRLVCALVQFRKMACNETGCFKPANIFWTIYHDTHISHKAMGDRNALNTRNLIYHLHLNVSSSNKHGTRRPTMSITLIELVEFEVHQAKSAVYIRNVISLFRSNKQQQCSSSPG